MTWLDDDIPRSHLGGEPREIIEGLIRDHDLPPPTEWTNYDVEIGQDEQRMLITDDDGFDYEFKISGSDVYDIDEWDWMWDIWEWLRDKFPDVELDSEYTEAA